MVLRQMAFRALATICTPMIEGFLQSKPLGMGKIIDRSIGLARPAAFRLSPMY